ncbi:DUF2520 domain-containing protein [Aggregicoccus sp. 17bor-14]|uniref:DUF2520 domain-containing protein n=1 Tax=Myxococcaceae TaxID=31 RepID=UPI0012F03B35|nr:DUF2520 domain-containing protein [Simulacricoccus sp. 17bor-14]MRI89878.1 DUF2520 domain-containing protein [Aggregicoccus sp. 17bor-14]
MSPRRPRRRAPARRRAAGSVVVVGVGRLGGALARTLQAAGWSVHVVARSAEARARARRLRLPSASAEALRSASVCLLCVPDGSVTEVAQALAPQLGPRAALVHCAGALTLDALGPQGARPVGSFHPLCAVSDARDSLAGHAVALASRSPAVLRLLRRLARAAELRPIEVPERGRAAYHAGAVLSAGGVVSLASAAVEALGAAGLEPGAALAALLPLMRSALRGMEARGLAGGLTGPVRRGDAGVVAAHLAALPASVAEVYRPLSRRALVLAGPQLSPAARAALSAALEG